MNTDKKSFCDKDYKHAQFLNQLMFDVQVDGMNMEELRNKCQLNGIVLQQDEESGENQGQSQEELQKQMLKDAFRAEWDRLQKLTVKDLLRICREWNIWNYSGGKKDFLIARIMLKNAHCSYEKFAC